MAIHRPEKRSDDASLCLDRNGEELQTKHVQRVYRSSNHMIKQILETHNAFSLQYFHTHMNKCAPTQISISISQYTAVVVSTAGNIWRHFESVYISKTLKNTAGARRVIRNQVTKKDCLNSNNSRLCVSLALFSPGTCSLSTHFSSVAHHLPFNEK